MAVFGKIAGEPSEEFGMTGRVGGVHEVDGMDETAAIEEGPDAVDDGGRVFGVVGGDGLGEFLASGEPGDGKRGEVFFEFLVLFEFPEPLVGWGDGVEILGVLFAFFVGFGNRFIGEEDELGLGGFTFEVGELIVAAVGALGDARPLRSFDVEAAAKEGNEAPVVTLFDFGSDGVVVALGALDLFAEESAGGADGHLVMAVALLVEEAGGTVFHLGFWTGDDEIESDLIPGTVAFEGPAEVVEPGLAIAPVFGAIEEDDVEDLGEMVGVFPGFGEAINEGVSFFRIRVVEKGLGFVGFGSAAEEVEVDPADEGGVVGREGGSDLFFLPFFGDELVDDLGGIPGRIGEDEFDRRGDFKVGDPEFEAFDFSRSELLLGRHVGIRTDLDGLKKGAFFRISWNEGRVGLAAFES